MAKYIRLKDGTFKKVEENEEKWKKNKDGSFSKVTAPIKETVTPSKKTSKDIVDLKTPQELTKKENTRDDGKGKIFKSGSFDDGYQFGDLIIGASATATDVVASGVKGLSQFAEGITDGILYGVSDISKGLGAKKFAKKTKELAEVNDTQEWYDDVKDQFVYDSLLGEDARGVPEGLGQVGAMIGIGAIGKGLGLASKGISALTTGTMFASSSGSGRSEAYEGGATDEEAIKYGLMQGGIDAGTELMFGGLGKGTKALGLSHGLLDADDLVAKGLTKGIKNQTMKNVAQGTIKGVGEGVEELTAGYLSAHAQKGTFRSEDDFKDIKKDQQLGKQFLTGMLVSDIAQAGSVVKASKQGVDYVSGYTQNEQSVVDKIANDQILEAEKDGKQLTTKEKNKIKNDVETMMQRGEIDIDTIESALGGDTYKAHESLVKEAEEFETLRNTKQGEMSDVQQDRLKELKAKNTEKAYSDLIAESKQKLSDEVRLATQNDMFLQESYAERGRRGEQFTVSEEQMKKYSEKEREIVQKAIDYGEMNNTRKAHEFVDLVAKLSADKGVSFDFTNNEKLKNSGFALKGKTINGFKSGNNIVVNLQSKNALNTVVGHEITHVLEGTALYDQLQSTVIEYAKQKGVYDSMYKDIVHLYRNQFQNETLPKRKALYDSEITADLVGQYIFSDVDFVRNLSMKNRNVFQKVYDEIKYMLKSVTSGSDAERQLLKAKKIFEDVYRDTKKNTSDKTQLSMTNNNYQKAVEKGDLKKAQKIVEKRAKSNGYEVFGYHGTNEGGFTQFDAKYSDDGISLFIAKNKKTAQSYTEHYTENEIDLNSNEKQEGLYRVAVKMENPYVIDGKGRNWDSLSQEKAVKNYDIKVDITKNGNSYGYVLKFTDGKNTVNTTFASLNELQNALPKNMSESVKTKLMNTLRSKNRQSMAILDVKTYTTNSTNVEMEMLHTNFGVNKKGEIIGKQRTRDWSRYAKEHGYDGVIIKNVQDSGGYSQDAKAEMGDIYIAFNSEQIKSLNAVTYDNKGNVIPLEKRFDDRKRDIRYSVTDNKGRTLTKEQQEKFKDSKVRDENGNLLTMYHGTPNGDYTIFRDGTYFTQNKEYADVYQNQGASSLGYKKTANNPKTYEVYLDIKKPFDTRNPKERAIFENEYYGQWGMGTPLMESGLPDWMDGEDLREFLEEKGYDYDGLILDEGGVGGYGDDVKSRGYSYVVFNPNQVKNVDNQKPTDNADIRYSISDNGKMVDNNGKEVTLETSDVGTHGTLMAIRNINEGELRGMLELDGIPVPSIAITNPNIVDHSNFGRISVLFDKETINPANKKNEVYDRDIWSSRFPTVEYEIDTKKASVLSDRGYKVGDIAYFNPVTFYPDNLEDSLRREKGEQGLIESGKNDYGLKNLYLAETSEPVNIVTAERTIETPKGESEQYSYMLQHMANEIAEVTKMSGKDWFVKYGEKFNEVEKAYWKQEVPTLTEEDLQQIVESRKPIKLVGIAKKIQQYSETGGKVVEQYQDHEATKQEIDNRINKTEYEAWLRDLYKGIEKSKGIRNNVDLFTPSGNRRSFKALHDSYTLENIVKNMTKGKTQGSEKALFGISAGAISSQMATRYKSISDIKKDEGRISANADEQVKPLTDRLQNGIDSLRDYYNGGAYNFYDSSTGAVFEFSQKKLTESNFRRILSEYPFEVDKIPSETLQEIIDSLNALKDIPTDYFEAKPQRAVGLDEIQAIVVPNDIDAQLRKDLIDKGLHIIEYNPNIEGDRQRVVNQFDELKFSLSEKNKPIAPIKNGIYAEDIALEKPIAPIQSVEPNKIMQEEVKESPSIVQEETFAPLTKQQAVNREQSDFDSFMALFDEDMPPETEAPIFDNDVEVNDPFEDRNIREVGKRNVNAYMYDNPEVKPFYQAEANIMLGELQSSTKGEKHYNDQLYYDTNGEQGFYGTKRDTSDAIADLLDNYNYSYADIEKGLNAIIKDHGAENIAVAKKIEFFINERLLNGYTDFRSGMEIPKNQEYINLLEGMQVNESANFDSLTESTPPLAPIGENVTKKRNVHGMDTLPLPQEHEVKGVRMTAEEKARKGEIRRWADTSTESEVVNGEVLLSDLDQDKIYYEPIPNKKTLEIANADLDRMGYDKALQVFNSKMESRTLSLSDIALGERLVQESLKRGDKKTTAELIQDISILGTELGQKVQALSIIQRMTPEGQLKMLQKIVNRGKAKGDKAFKNVEITDDMRDKILDAYNQDGTYDQNKLNEAVENVKQQIADDMEVSNMDRVNAWRMLSMLGNPKTHIRNVVSNITMQATNEMKNAIARTVETIAPIKNRTKTWKSASADVKKFAVESTKEAESVLMGEHSYSEVADIKAKRKVFGDTILQKVYDFNSNLLTKEDAFFKRPVYRKCLQEFLTANGIKTQEDIQKNKKLVEKGKQYALDQSQIATFQQYSWLANKINEIERKNVATQIGVGAVLPFKKTPINIAKTGLAYSPLGFAKSLSYDLVQMKKGNMEASQVIDNLSKGLTGSALVYVGYMLAMSGLLNGGGEDDKEGKYDYQLGEQSYSLNFGGNTYSLSWLTPVAMPLFVGANAYEMFEEEKELTFDTTADALAQTLDPMSEMSFLSSLDSVLTSYESGAGKFMGIFETAGQNYVTQFAPTLLSQVAQVTDDKKRSTQVSADSDARIIEQTINKLKYKIPLLRQTLEPTIDIWGNEVKQSENMVERAVETFIAPYSRKESIATEIDEEIKGLYSQTGDTGIIPIVPSNKVKYGGETYKMSAREFTDYKKTYGKTANEMLEDLFRTETYQNADSTTRADLINKVYDYARDVSKKAYLEKEGVEYTNTTQDGVPVYKENKIKGAIDNDMMLEEFDLYTKSKGKYYISKLVGGYDSYKTYTNELNDLVADKNASGKSIPNSLKNKKFAYINNLNVPFETKMLLWKQQYPADDRYNVEIIEYLNNRQDISYEEMVEILTELDFKVSADGTVRW